MKHLKTLFLTLSPLLAFAGMALSGQVSVAAGLSPVPPSKPTNERHPPAFFLTQVVNGEDNAEGLAPLEMEQAWQAQTLSDGPLMVKAEAVSRYAPDDNEGRKCARVKGSIGQDLVPLKGKTYKDCGGDKGGESCKPFYVIAELDMCADGLPPTANYNKYAKESQDKGWKPPVTEIKEPATHAKGVTP